MTVDREAIERWIRDYQCGDTSSKQKIIDELAFYIRHFPQMAYGERDEDALSDFYLFSYQRLEGILRNFDFKKASFWTYLSKCLVNSWYDFVGKKDEAVYDSLPAELSSEMGMLGEVGGELSVDTLFEEEENREHRLILKLYFFDYFQEKDLIFLQSVSGTSFGQCLQFLDALMEDIMHKRQRATSMEAKINKLHGRILAYQNEKQKQKGSWDPQKQKQLDDLQDRFVERYRGALVYPSFKLIGDFWEGIG